jgi:hypothetical protein
MTMVSRFHVLSVGVVLAFGLLVHSGAAAQPGGVRKPVAPAQPHTPAIGAPQPSVPSATTHKAEQLTKQQFDALADSAVIDVKGQQTTKAKIVAKLTSAKGAKARADEAARQVQAKFATERDQFAQQQQAKIKAGNANVAAPVASAPGTTSASQRQALHDEATQLLNRSKSASPAERAAIDKRAAELLKQLQQLGR